MLHIVNGGSVGIGEAGIAGEVVCWDDALHEGPVPSLPLGELSAVRARFIAEAFGVPAHDVEASFRKRDAALQSYAGHDELVLWFEHDLYDQLQLIQILAYLSEHPAEVTRISLIQADAYLGPLRPEQLARLFPSRRLVTKEQLRVASAAWAAFTDSHPGHLLSILDDDLSALRYLKPALRRHLEQFPWISDGLSRTQRQILRVVADGARTMGEAFVADRKLEEPQFMGDSAYALHARSLAACRRPLLDGDGGAAALDGTLRITAAGRAVLEGGADHVAWNGIDRWLGGVCLCGAEHIWRYNGSTLVR